VGFLILRDRTSNKVISQNVIVANSFFKRLKGLMFTKELPPESAVFIYPCSSIHTCFMNYNIDVLYLDKNNIILAIDEDMEPWRFGKIIKGSVSVIEIPIGTVARKQIKIGQALELV